MLTVSDGASAGQRDDASGDALEHRLSELGYQVERAVVPDDAQAIASAVQDRAPQTALIVATGGTGLGPRDVTPQALAGIAEYEIPGFGEAMRAAGRASTAMADLSRSLAVVVGRSLVVAVPGSPSGATESLEAIVPLLEHALETLGGHTAHGPSGTAPSAPSPAA